MTFMFEMFLWAVMVYLVGQVAYTKGRKDKWEEMCREYICIHKSVCIREIDRKKPEKPLTKPTKKSRIKNVVKHAKQAKQAK